VLEAARAIEDDMVPAGFGTQTAASIIRPASYCGVVGYKPTYGTFSLAGIKPFAESFDTLGLLARSAVDARYLRCALLDSGFRHDAKDASATPRVGLCRTPWWDEAEPASRHALAQAAVRIERSGARIGDADLPASFARLAEVHKSIMAYEAARNYAYEFDAHREELSESLRHLIEAGARMERGSYEAACTEARQAREHFDRYMTSFDFLIAPSAKGEAPVGLHATGDPLFSRLWTLLRVPTVTLSSATGARGLPVGVQLVGRMRDDDSLLRWAEWIELRLSS
jgi:amidase